MFKIIYVNVVVYSFKKIFNGYMYDKKKDRMN